MSVHYNLQSLVVFSQTHVDVSSPSAQFKHTARHIQAKPIKNLVRFVFVVCLFVCFSASLGTFLVVF